MNTVLITGASSGIGKATALHFADRGWQVIATMRKQATISELENRENVLITPLDVRNADSIQAAVADGIQRFGSIDALINSAGYGLMGVFESASLDQIKQQYEVNVFGLMRVTQAVLPYMRQQGGGSIVNISSFGGVVALPFGSLYNSSKFAVEGFSESLSHEVASFNIRVKLVEPGSVATAFRSNLEMIPNQLPDYNSIMGSFFQRYSGITDHLAKASVSDVANTIYQACTDESPQLRYVVGEDAQFYIDLKRGNNDDAFITQMRQYFFQ
ncbi:SDR family oxidoreductase [Spirosoma litoris]